MSATETRSKILLALAEAYENEKEKRPYIGFENQTEEQTMIVAELKAEGYVEGHGSTIRFTGKGYSHFGALVTALRNLPAAE